MLRSAGLPLALAVWLVSGPALGQDAVTSPQWVRKPSAAGLHRLFPRAAWEAGVSGRAIVECTVTGEGTLTDCKVVEETPPGYGFGQATIRAAAKFRMRPRAIDGTAVAGRRVRVPLVWRRG